MKNVSIRQQEKSIGFLKWQGVLILLPALILAVIGFYSLRKDRALAEHDAREQAAGLAKEMLESTVASALRIDTIPLERVAALERRPFSVASDPIDQYSEPPRSIIAFLIDPNGELIYPTAWQPVLAPALVPSALFTPAQADLWNRGEAALNGPPELAIDFLTGFLTTDPPLRAAAIAQYQLAVVLQKKGDFASAQSLFESLLKRFPDASTENGVAIAPLAQWHLLQMTNGPPAKLSRSELWSDGIGSWALLHPSWFSARLVEWLTELNPSSVRWQQAFREHDRARQAYRQWRQDQNSSSHWRHFNGQEFYVQTVPQDNGRWIFFRERGAVTTALQSAFAAKRMPAFARVQLRLAGVPIELSSTGQKQKLTGAPRLAEAGDGLATVEILLVSPGVLFERQRLRTISFGVLIAISTLSVLAGYVANWRALQKERRLSAMRSNFVSSISHEIRAPIASVRLMAEELIELAGGDPAKAEEYHQCILHECRRLASLIENVLDFARHEQGRTQYEFEPTDIRQLIADTVCLMKPYAAEKSVHLQLASGAARSLGNSASDAERFEPEIDGRAMQQVLVNLIDNAIKHSPAGACVTVGLDDARERRPSDAVATRDSAAFASRSFAFWVEDHGPGIPPDEREKIFDQFYRRGSELRRETQGIGLGLAIVRLIVEAHGGHIRLESELGKGSLFRVELPKRTALDLSRSYAN